MILCVANRDDPISYSKGTLLITFNGTLTITNQNSIVIRSVNTADLTNPIAKLLGTGNFVVKEDDNDSKIHAWQGFDLPTDTLIPGMKLGVDYTRGAWLAPYSMESNHDSSSGQQYLELDTSSGDPDISLNIAEFKEWRSGPLDGIQFDGIPEMVQKFEGYEIFILVNTSKEVAYSYQLTDQFIMPRLVVNHLTSQASFNNGSGGETNGSLVGLLPRISVTKLDSVVLLEFLTLSARKFAVACQVLFQSVLEIGY